MAKRVCRNQRNCNEKDPKEVHEGALRGQEQLALGGHDLIHRITTNFTPHLVANGIDECARILPRLHYQWQREESSLHPREVAVRGQAQ